MEQSPSGPPVSLFEGKHLRMVRDGRWEFVQRRNLKGVVGIVAITPDAELLLVEQYRTPCRASVIELPAGLAGDLTDAADEELATAARRELLEETGYDAAELLPLTQGPSSAGMSDEIVTLFLARGLKRVNAGGGDGLEDITVHRVPLAEAPAWLAAHSASGRLIDYKVWAALWFALQSVGQPG